MPPLPPEASHGELLPQPLDLTLDDIKARERAEVTFTMECSGNTGLPFFTGGAVISIAFSRLTSRINVLYAADLIGAAAGCVALIPLLPEEPIGEEKLSALTALSSLPA